MSQWNTGLFGCFKDCRVCLLGTCCPCYLFGQNAEQLTGEGKVLSCVKYCVLFPCALCVVFHKPKRAQLRGVYSLEEKPNDILATCCCSPCALCQEHYEMKARGAVPGKPITTSQPR